MKLHSPQLNVTKHVLAEPARPTNQLSVVVDEKAMLIAERLAAVVSREATSRQCAAAQISALFHHVYNAKPKETPNTVKMPPHTNAEEEVQSLSTVITAQLAQNAIAKFVKEKYDKPCKTLAIYPQGAKRGAL